MLTLFAQESDARMLGEKNCPLPRLRGHAHLHAWAPAGGGDPRKQAAGFGPSENGLCISSTWGPHHLAVASPNPAGIRRMDSIRNAACWGRGPPQEAQRVLEAGRKEGTGWVKVDSELVAKVDTALDSIRTDLKKADRENNSLYFQVPPPGLHAPPCGEAPRPSWCAAHQWCLASSRLSCGHHTTLVPTFALWRHQSKVFGNVVVVR